MPAPANPELEAIRHLSPTPDRTSLSAARKQSRRFIGEPDVSRRMLTASAGVLPGACGSPEVTVRIYPATDRTGPLPDPPYPGGSAFVLGTIDTADPSARRIIDRMRSDMLSAISRMLLSTRG